MYMQPRSGACATHLCPEDLGGVSDTAKDTHTTSVGHSCGELRASSDVHSVSCQSAFPTFPTAPGILVPSEEDRVLDAEELGNGGGDLGDHGG